MSRGLPNAALADLYAPNTGGEWVVLLTITHSGIAGSPLRFAGNLANVTSSGNTFTAFPFHARLPADRDDVPRAILTIDCVDQQVVAAARTITSPAAVLVEVVRLAAPDTVLASWDLTMRGYELKGALDVQLAPPPIWEEGYPGTDYTPLGFPAGFDR